MIDGLLQDLTYAIRSLRRSSGFTCLAVVSLAVCIAAGAFIFATVTLMLGFSKPVERVDQLVDIFTNVRDQPFQTSSYPDYLDVRSRNTVFQDVVASGPVIAALNPGGGSRMVIGESVSGNYFETLGVHVLHGRPIVAADDRPGAPRVVVLSHGLWQREFGGRADALGRTVRIKGQTYTVVGIAPADLVGMTPFPAQLWVPLTWLADVGTMGITDFVPSPGTTPLERRGERWLFIKGRLSPGQTIQSARTDLTAVMGQLEREYPVSNKGRRLAAVLTKNVRYHPMADQMLAVGAGALSVVIGLLLLVGCANVTGMQLARTTSRLREMAIRLALGAGRARLIRQLLTESLLLAGAGGLLALALIWVLMKSLAVTDLAMPIPITMDPELGTGLIGFAATAALLSGFLAGLVPALRATRSSQAMWLKNQMPGVRLRRRWTLRDGLVVTQTAAAALLLIVAALLTRSMVVAGRIDVGFDASNVTAFTTGISAIGYDSLRAQRFYTSALDAIRRLPEVQEASLVWRTPFDLTFYQDPILLPDRHTSNDQVVPTERTIVSPEYFATLGVRIIEGRNFGPLDTLDSPRVAIVNQSMARRYWPTGSAVGQRFRIGSLTGPEYLIVGVSADYKVRTVGEPPTPYIHFAQSQRLDDEWTILVKSRAGFSAPVEAVHRVLANLEPDLLFRANSMDAKLATVLLPASAAAYSLGIAGSMAMLFAAIGLYGVVAFMVAQRTHEFGVRLALGAKPRQVIGLVLQRGLTMAAVGVIVGGVAAAAAAKALAGVLYGVGPADPLAWLMAFAVVLGICLLAHAVPARRAATVNPVDSLRAE
jgi:predicted permease